MATTRERPLKTNKLILAGTKKDKEKEKDTTVDDFLENNDEIIELDNKDINFSQKIDEINTNEKVIVTSSEEIIVKEEVKTESLPQQSTSGTILITTKAIPVKKKYATYYLKESITDKIERFAGQGRGKSGYNKSELVELLLEKAFEIVKFK